MNQFSEIVIEVKGKAYLAYLDDAGNIAAIQSITNPNKTPYLDKGSKRYSEVYEAVYNNMLGKGL